MNGRWWIGAVLLSGAVYGLAWWALDGQARESDQRAQARRDSIVSHYATRYTRDSVRLEQWRDSIESMPPDTLIRRVVRYIRTHDTAWVDTGSTDTVGVVRWLAVSDSAQRVRGDSLQGELDQCVYDLNEAMSRPAPAPRWSWGSFEAGVGVGAAGAAAACILAR